MRQRGFTLIEAVAALALASILVYVSAYAFVNAAPRQHLARTAWEVAGLLNNARFKAVWSGSKYRVRVDYGRLFLERFDEPASEWRVDRVVMVEGASVEANNSPVFHPVGTVSDMATITVSNRTGGYRITVAITGRVKSVRLN